MTRTLTEQYERDAETVALYLTRAEARRLSKLLGATVDAHARAMEKVRKDASLPPRVRAMNLASLESDRFALLNLRDALNVCATVVFRVSIVTTENDKATPQ